MNSFAPEVFLFDVSNCNIRIDHNAGKRKQSLSKNKNIVDDVWYHKMNDTMYDPKEFVQQHNASCRLLLRYDGYSNKEIDKFHDKNNYLVMPPLNERSVRARQNKSTLTKKEKDYLHSLLSSGKIVLNLNPSPR
jgi:hypothetical protein